MWERITPINLMLPKERKMEALFSTSHTQTEASAPPKNRQPAFHLGGTVRSVPSSALFRKNEETKIDNFVRGGPCGVRSCAREKLILVSGGFQLKKLLVLLFA